MDPRHDRGGGFAEHCAELFAALGDTRLRRMFGGHGLYLDGLFVAIVSADLLYLKADAQTRPRFEAAGCKPFVYDREGRKVSLGYWSAPGEACESPAQLQPWARLALGAALRARTARPASARRSRRAVADAPAAKPSAKAASRRHRRAAMGRG